MMIQAASKKHCVPKKLSNLNPLLLDPRQSHRKHLVHLSDELIKSEQC